MRKCFEWLVEHEKLVVAITCALVIALVVQIKFCKGRVEPEANLTSNPQTTNGTPSSSSATIGIAGRWEMSIQKKKGGTQTWMLILEQNGETLTGVISSEGGDLPVTGTIKGQTIDLSATRFGVTVSFPATLNGDTITGTMNVLTVTRQWTAKRL